MALEWALYFDRESSAVENHATCYEVKHFAKNDWEKPTIHDETL